MKGVHCCVDRFDSGLGFILTPSGVDAVYE